MSPVRPPQQSEARKQAAAEITLLIGVLRESFVATLPFIILSSATTLLLNLLSWQGISLGNEISGIMTVFEQLFPIAITLSIAYHLGRRYGINGSMAVLLAIVVSAASNFSYREADAAHAELLSVSLLSALVVPILSTLLLRIFITLYIRFAATEATMINPIREALNYVFPFMAAFATALAFLLAIKPVFVAALTILQALQPPHSGEVLVIIRTVFSHLLWYFGLHGDNTAAAAPACRYCWPCSSDPGTPIADASPGWPLPLSCSTSARS
jgi:cellobiose-specific phosphotransferase system component IIC